MKIISGNLKSREIITPKSTTTRPTSNRVRESIYNILFHRYNIKEVIESINILDIFAGTGSLSIEGLSRGASSFLLIEKDLDIFAILKKNIYLLYLNKKTTLVNADILSYENNNILAHELCFIDAPYLSGLNIAALKKIYESKWINIKSIIVCETSVKDKKEYPDLFKVNYSKKYGNTKVDFLKINY